MNYIIYKMKLFNNNTPLIANIYRNNIDWNHFTNVAHFLGKELNDRKLLMDKADILEQTISMCSKGMLVWIDDTAMDFRDIKHNINIEFKTVELYTEKTNKLKKNINVRIKNTRGHQTSDIIDKMEHSDYYILGNQNGVGIISWEDMSNEKILVKGGDGINAKIPNELITMLIKKNEIKIKSDLPKCTYKEDKKKLQKNLIESIFKLLESDKDDDDMMSK